MEVRFLGLPRIEKRPEIREKNEQNAYNYLERAEVPPPFLWSFFVQMLHPLWPRDSEMGPNTNTNIDSNSGSNRITYTYYNLGPYTDTDSDSNSTDERLANDKLYEIWEKYILPSWSNRYHISPLVNPKGIFTAFLQF